MHTTGKSGINSPRRAEFEISRATGRAAARFALRLSCADERARHLAINLGRDPVDVDAGVGEERPRIVDLIYPPRFELDVKEPCRLQLCCVLVISKRARHASNPQLHAAANLRWHLPANDDVRDGESATGFEYAERFAQNGILVSGQVNDAVRDNDVDRLVR